MPPKALAQLDRRFQTIADLICSRPSMTMVVTCCAKVEGSKVEKRNFLPVSTAG